MNVGQWQEHLCSAQLYAEGFGNIGNPENDPSALECCICRGQPRQDLTVLILLRERKDNKFRKSNSPVLNKIVKVRNILLASQAGKQRDPRLSNNFLLAELVRHSHRQIYCRKISQPNSNKTPFCVHADRLSTQTPLANLAHTDEATFTHTRINHFKHTKPQNGHDRLLEVAVWAKMHRSTKRSLCAFFQVRGRGYFTKWHALSSEHQSKFIITEQRELVTCYAAPLHKQLFLSAANVPAKWRPGQLQLNRTSRNRVHQFNITTIFD